ncbi:MAG: Holliday junction resolvase RuvX [Lachnospiraceae bacterium]|nr:Holliday junction resolvase RuvX [Lachnospiraceae bacterium]
MRLMGLDLGSKTCGVALSDTTGSLATGLEIIRREKENHLRKTLARIEEIIVEYGVKHIVLGLPLNMDGTEGERAKLSRDFKDKLERRTGLPVTLMDERLTTVEADEIMADNGIKGKDKKKYVDMIAASVILQDYLDNRG